LAIKKSKLYSAGAFWLLRPSVPHVKAAGVVKAAGSNQKLILRFDGFGLAPPPDWRGA
jgi:hypothetical protein